MKTLSNSLWEKLNIEDQISLITQLQDAYDEKTLTAEIVLDNSSKAHKYIENNSTVCGVKDRGTIEAFQISKVLIPIIPEKIPIRDKSFDIDIFDMTIDWEALKNYSGILHDQEATNPYGPFRQNQILKNRIRKKVIADQLFELEISEEILGSYYATPNPDRRLNHERSNDHFIQFYTSLKKLEKERFLVIKSVYFNFLAEPESNNFVGQPPDFPAYDVVFGYKPAKHCLALIKILKEEKRVLEDEIEKEKSYIASITDQQQAAKNEYKITKDWKVIEKETEADIVYKNKAVFTFKQIDTDTYNYFQYLAKNYGRRIEFEEMCKIKKQKKEETTKKTYLVHKEVIRKIRYLRDILHKKGLKKIKINLKGFFRITIK